ncbi:uncharacterized protein PAC_09131 [Phialocephala subalpina]|uniref:Oxidase ustYa n=1 Tax=Phialocephala subalpina TaxID=576137 RepID=A0A1L7X2J4_9HELO|nr:uncharacterized protein PAC_09131 [Phialocephala subalpina]
MPLSKDLETAQTGYQKLLEEESFDYEKTEYSRPLSSCHGLFSYRVAFWTLSLLYVVTVVLSFAAWPSEPSSNMALYGIIDIPFDDKVVFMPDRDFVAPTDSMTGEDPWATLEPAGRGFIQVPVENPLAGGGSVIDSQYYCISMFHQLHCIASLKAAFDSMMNKSHTGDGHPLGHLNHCFDYLRQATMCAGDMTLEPAVEYTDIGRKGVEGWNVEHRCRNFQAMKDFAEGHRYLNSTGIL